MQIKSPFLLLEINKFEFVFAVAEKRTENVDFNIIFKLNVPIENIEKNNIVNVENSFENLRNNIYSIEKKFNTTFKEIIILIDDFDITYNNLTGFLKLNGSQLDKKKITYILNSLKSSIDEHENKFILHIFNSKFSLDKKKLENLPLGLFGDFYTHELSFSLINKNDYKNLENIIKKCNLRIRKVVLKNFIKGVDLISLKNAETFFKIEIMMNNTKLIFFENSALKFSQNFNFGTDIIMNDITKVLSLKKDYIRKFLSENVLIKQYNDQEYLEKKYFGDENFRKIKKKIIYDIVSARIQEIAEIILFKNINIFSLIQKKTPIFISVEDELSLSSFKEIYETSFSKNNTFALEFMKKQDTKDVFHKAMNTVHFGWKKEAVPIVQTKKSIIARFFDLIFS